MFANLRAVIGARGVDPEACSSQVSITSAEAKSQDANLAIASIQTLLAGSPWLLPG